jgi:hypothetical protein
MPTYARSLLAVLVLASPPALALAGEGHSHGTPTYPSPDAAKQERCGPHGVPKSLCTRCNPKLAAVYKAKGDWCAEHERPESQCVLCHPELAKQGVK